MNPMTEKKLTLSSLGEKKIISDIIRELPLKCKNHLLLNDDAQIIPVQSSTPLSISTDRTPTNLRALCLGVMSLFEYGRYCVISNLSDIAAMGAYPIGFLLNIAASPTMLITDFKEIMDGVCDALNEYETPLMGGDTKEASELNLVGIALGQGFNDKILTRSNAKPGDYLVVSKGNLGLTPTAFAYFDKMKSLDIEISGIDRDELIDSLVKVQARFNESKILSDSGVCTSCMDNTDGLYSSFVEIVNASHIGLDIDLSDIQVSSSVICISSYINISPHKLIISAGADFKLVGTVTEVTPDISEAFQVIGRVTDKYNEIHVKGILNNELKSISRWNHFNG
jgi:thiamine-monophosphate kinase